MKYGNRILFDNQYADDIIFAGHINKETWEGIKGIFKEFELIID